MNNGLLLKPNTLFQFQLQTPFFSQITKTHHSLPSTHLKFPSFHLKPPSTSHLFSSKTPTQPETRTEAFDPEDEFDSEFEEDEEEEEEDEDEEVFVPLRNMRQWTRNKPRGFGEGKVYDTSLEDKLLEELEQSRVAQLVNINNLKNSPVDEDTSAKKDNVPKQKDLKVVPNGTRVRLINLPKKKNIHRDLQAAFKPFTGIINIIPAVIGNEKTRDPVCKGFAFVDFKSEKEAKRFVDIISTQPITFGKVQKQIRCEIVKPSSPAPASVQQPVHRVKSALPVLNANEAVRSNPILETPVESYVEDAAFDMLKVGDDDLVTTDEYNDNNIHDVVQEEHEAAASSESEPLKKQKVREKGKKTAVAKKKAEKTPKLNIPGSAKRLKTKEKALLSGVFSKYAGKSSD